MSSTQDTDGNILMVTEADIAAPGKPVGLTNPSANEQALKRDAWASAVIDSFAQINPLPPYYNIPFPIAFFNIYKSYP